MSGSNYRERHDDGLISMAKRQAERAVTEGKVVILQPMTARDRRVIHMSLAKFEGVSTMSQGEGTRRRIQIIPARKRR
jgi:spoIIIJ-associated protein